MLVDILSPGNYVSYNVYLAHMLGLDCAIYLSELLRIDEQSNQNDTTGDGKFTVDRAYIARRTTFDDKKQKSLDERLSDIGIVSLEKPKGNVMSLNLPLLVDLVSENDENSKKAFEKFLKTCEAKNKKKTKEEVMRENLYTCIRTENAELREAYTQWIDAIFDRFGWMAKASVTFAQDAVDKESSYDLDVALDIIKIATINGYKDMQWAINTYESDKRKKPFQKSIPQVNNQPLLVSAEKF